uniref:CASP-like protein n=1 Tax=Davidia involucrata TaxID=16924 RepID=A0A5B7B8D4_DAVIN
METQNMPNGSAWGTEAGMDGGGGKEVMRVQAANKTSTVRCCELVLRALAFALTLVASVLLGIDKQTKVVPISLASTLPPLNVPVTAKWHYMSAFVYFVVTNDIACSYAAVSLFLTILANRGGKRGLALMITILDLVMVALLFSGNGATAAVGLLGYQGNSHVLWNKVCNVFGKFCHQVAAAVILSLLGSLAFLWLVALAALNLHKKHK